MLLTFTFSDFSFFFGRAGEATTCCRREDFSAGGSARLRRRFGETTFDFFLVTRSSSELIERMRFTGPGYRSGRDLWPRRAPSSLL